MFKRRRNVEETASRALERELQAAVDAGEGTAVDPTPAAIVTFAKTLSEVLPPARWCEVFDLTKSCPERSKALDVILDMPAAYEVLGSGMGAMRC